MREPSRHTSTPELAPDQESWTMRFAPFFTTRALSMRSTGTGALGDTVREVDALAPSLSVTVSVTWKLPADMYDRLAVIPLPMAPSPKDQL